MIHYTPKKDSTAEFNQKYANNDDCEVFFFKTKYLDESVCEKSNALIRRRFVEDIPVLPDGISRIVLQVQFFRITCFLYTSECWVFSCSLLPIGYQYNGNENIP